jgi:hypothetical protein
MFLFRSQLAEFMKSVVNDVCLEISIIGTLADVSKGDVDHVNVFALFLT